jgi:hypothetical protein
LRILRGHIAANWKDLLAITNDRSFKRMLGELQGERLLRPPAGFSADHPATTTDVESETLGVKRIVRQPRKLFGLHLAAAPAQDASDHEFQVDARIPAGQIANPAQPAVVERSVTLAADAPDRFFSRRESPMTRALGSPKMPRMVVVGKKPGKRYVSWSLRCKPIRRSCHVSSISKNHKTCGQQGVHKKNSCFLPTIFGEEAIK